MKTLKQMMILDHHASQRRHEIKRESKRQAALEFLGVKWVLHPKNAPVKGRYNSFGLKVA